MNQDSILLTLLRPADSLMEEHIDTCPAGDAICYDSVFAPYRDLEVVERPSMFGKNTSQREVVEPRMRLQSDSQDWVFGATVLLLAILSIYLNAQKFKIKDIFSSLFDKRTLGRVFRDNNLKSLSLLPMSVVYVSGIALLVWQVGGRMMPTAAMQPGLQYLLLVVAMAAYFLVRNGLLRLFGVIFDEKNATALYITNIYLFYFVGALVATPLMLLTTYCAPIAETCRYIFAIIIAILFIIRLLRGMQLILTTSNASKLYLFYYFCILEIVPILIIYRVLIN